ncbi:MAG: SLBB domain-containing protein [Deltaproteobacteria bacterium]|nr:SLBB domain-containing protein [Deltaproteobacteria bacterium]
MLHRGIFKSLFIVLFLCFFSFPVKAADPSPDNANQEKSKQTAQQHSVFENYASETLSHDSEAVRIEQFGYRQFMPSSDPFLLTNIMPVGPDYLLGPGDELHISIWGKISGEYRVPLDRDGKIVLPEFGVLHISGLTFEQARDYLNKELARYYKTSEVFMNVSVGTLRSMRVFVIGKASNPGSHVVSSMSTLINALYAADGPGKSGSMRDIQVKRGGKTIVHFDLYDFLIKGDKTNDIRLQPDDVVFIPQVGPLVAVSGSVKSPAIYELKDEKTIEDVVRLAGGFNDIAFTNRLRINRIVDNNRITVFEARLDEASSNKVKVRPGDIISIFPVVSEARTVKLYGAVQREGKYGVGDGLTIKELIALSGGLKYFAFTDDAEITRVTPTPKGPATTKIHINLDKALKGDPEHNISLKEDDFILVRAVPEWDLYKSVQISGQVKFPGTYTVMKGETVSSLINRAGGFTDKAYLKGAFFTRPSVRGAQQKQLDEAIDRAEFEFFSESAQNIQSAFSSEDAKQLQLASMAQRKSLLAKLKSAKANGRVYLNFEPFDKFKGSQYDIVLDEGDEIHIPERPMHVQVVGSVYNQMAFAYVPGATVYDYIKKAGGISKNADEDELYILKVNGTAISKHESSSWSVNWDSESGKWVTGFMSTRLDPGDTIVVPEDIEQVSWVREVKDLTQILYQIAVTAGVLIVAF